MKDFLKKLTSRKFLAAAAGVAAGLAMVFRLDENVIATVSGMVTTLGSLVAYILTEGSLDAQAMRRGWRCARRGKAGGVDICADR